jgi:hypothetical protein
VKPLSVSTQTIKGHDVGLGLIGPRPVLALNATIRLVILRAALPPTRSRAARSSEGVTTPTSSCSALSVLLTGASSPPFELVRLKRRTAQRQHTLSVPERGLLNPL